MPQIQIGTSTNQRRTTWSPTVRAVNMLVEKAATNQFTGVDHIQRPGEVLFSTVGAGPVRGVFRQAGTLGGDFITVSGDELYRVTDEGVATLIDDLPGSLRVSMAATAARVLIESDALAYSTDGATVVPVVMPDDRPVGSVAQLNGYFILSEYDSARFYWIEPGQVDPDGLSFATTESTPGAILKVERVGDELWFFKEEGIEVWVPTGDADLPFQRVPGRNYDKGCRSRDTVARFDNSVSWVGNDGLIYRGDNAPVRMSTNSEEEMIRKSSPDDLRAWSFSIDGHSLYCLTVTGATIVFDASSGQWCEFQTYGEDWWRCHVGDMGETFTVAGDRDTGRLYRLDPEVSNDAGLPLVRIAMGGNAAVGQALRCNSLDVYCTTGTAEDPNLYPKMRISWSDDLETYGDFEDVSIGRQGDYGEPVRLNRLGVIRYPGRLWKFQCTDDVVWTLHAAAFNEPSR